MTHRHTVLVDGHRLSYLEAGPSDGPVVLLVHGLLSDSTTWDPVIAPLAAHGLRVIALDLIGHGASDKPQLAYYLDDFASSISGFITALDLGPVTLVGHSLGGAIAMQFAKHHPTQLARLVLVSSGGLGQQVHPILRAATLPGVRSLLRVAVNRRTARLYAHPQLHRALRLRPESVVNLTRMGQSVLTLEGRSTFVTAVRAVITPSGQLGDMIEHGYVAADLPTLIISSAEDPIIPVQHAIDAHERLPESRLDLFAGATHEPHRREPQRFADTLASFIGERFADAPPPAP